MIAIIPARGGSKGLPRKNIKLFHGKPLIAYTIEAALNSKYIERVIVSTEDAEIAEISKKYGAEVPFLRPAELATDTSKAIDAYVFTVESLQEINKMTFDQIVILQPTSPLRKATHIDEAIELFFERGANSIISVTPSDHPPQWYKTIDTQGVLHSYIDSDNSKNRQELELTYIPNGAIYVFNYSFLKENASYYSDSTYAYVMEKRFSIDIDSMYDFALAEIIYHDNLRITFEQQKEKVQITIN
ncbi:cytidylyltransferase domain-containing protein [Fusibacter sp. 3D3]|uniref:acylneuraminate cytidylyltransferase family protein n=1 Tax=Fusibacter sp. 3D3 TaxID=1048380 RepID=UPI000852AEEB|nr:acylneuraminate cytidylyltransferase family protein [Fusibacter sp. 3D3]GAU77771.1 N-acetylneuraminate cytidylyltransferase [Fusibacter sp. 3D3]